MLAPTVLVNFESHRDHSVVMQTSTMGASGERRLTMTRICSLLEGKPLSIFKSDDKCVVHAWLAPNDFEFLSTRRAQEALNILLADIRVDDALKDFESFYDM
eukprot:3448913-Amphidinium_carterae.1